MGAFGEHPRVPLPLVHIDAVPFVGRWAYLLWRLRCPQAIVEFPLPDERPKLVHTEAPPPSDADPIEHLDYALERAVLLAELCFARLLNTYERLPLYPKEVWGSSPSRQYLELSIAFRYSEWKPEKTLFGMLSEFWETIFEAWEMCRRRGGVIPLLDAEPSRLFQQQLEGWASEDLSGHAFCFRREPWFVWHAEQEELDESLVEHPVGQFRELCERIFRSLADWNATPYRLSALMPKAAELVDYMGALVELIEVRCRHEMEEF